MIVSKNSLILLLVLTSLVSAQPLIERLWSYQSGETVTALAFTETSLLLIGTEEGTVSYLDSEGNLLRTFVTGSAVEDAEERGFVTSDGHVYLIDPDGSVVANFTVGANHSESVTVLNNYFVACGTACAFFDIHGNKLWDVDVGQVQNGPACLTISTAVGNETYCYIPDINNSRVLIIRDGTVLGVLSYLEGVVQTKGCGPFLAVATTTKVHLYEVDDPIHPNEVWNLEGLINISQIAASSACEYIVVADAGDNKLKVFDLNTTLIAEYGFDTRPVALALWQDPLTLEGNLAVDLSNGTIVFYKFSPPSSPLYSWQGAPLPPQEPQTPPPQKDFGIPSVSLLALLLAGLSKRRG